MEWLEVIKKMFSHIWQQQNNNTQPQFIFLIPTNCQFSTHMFN